MEGAIDEESRRNREIRNAKEGRGIWRRERPKQMEGHDDNNDTETRTKGQEKTRPPK